jgi:argininosuccinate synthase
MAKVALAYSGGLDTSIAIQWLRSQYNVSVIAFVANLGQGKYLEPLGERAVEAGAESAIVQDVRDTFAKDYIVPTLQAECMYETGYYLATALGRPLIAAELVRVALQNNCEYVAHGCTGKGNDQVRFETAVASLAPELKVIACAREWEFKSREQEIDYAHANNIPIPVGKENPYSIDRNMWGVSIECGELEDPWAEPPKDAWQTTADPQEAPDEPEELTIDFKKGVPTAVNGKRMSLVKLIDHVGEIAGKHGVGRCDQVENRMVGIKSREIYEAPAGEVLMKAHRGLEELTQTREMDYYKGLISRRMARLVYDGQWFTSLREACSSFITTSQKFVTGKTRVKLYKGSCTVVGRASPHSLYREDLATYTEDDAFDHSAAEGYIKITSLPNRAEATQESRKPDA